MRCTEACLHYNQRKDTRYTEACLHYNWGRTRDTQRPACITTRGRTPDSVGPEVKDTCRHYHQGPHARQGTTYQRQWLRLGVRLDDAHGARRAVQQAVDMLHDAKATHQVVALQQAADTLQLFLLQDVHGDARVHSLLTAAVLCRGNRTVSCFCLFCWPGRGGGGGQGEAQQGSHLFLSCVPATGREKGRGGGGGGDEQTHKQREKEKEREREADRQTDGQTERGTEDEREGRERQTERERERVGKDRDRGTETDGQTERQTERESDR